MKHGSLVKNNVDDATQCYTTVLFPPCGFVAGKNLQFRWREWRFDMNSTKFKAPNLRRQKENVGVEAAAAAAKKKTHKKYKESLFLLHLHTLTS